MGEDVDDEQEYYALTKRVWHTFAPFYDTVTMPFLSKLRDQVVDLTTPKKGSKILDVATGTGEQALAFARKGYDVVGIDISDDMLKVAKEKNKFGRVKFGIADATNLPFVNASFDLTCISFALHDMPSTIRPRVLKEMARVTKSGGVMLIVDYSLPRGKFRRFLVYHLVKLYEGPYYESFIKSDIVALLRETGIETTEELPVVLGVGRVLKGMVPTTT